MSKVAIAALLIFLSACTEKSRVEGEVRAALKDPDAARFQEVEVCSADKAIYTGEVNAKNGYGAYNGFNRFYFADGQTVFYDDDDDGYDNEKYHRLAARCNGTPYVDPSDAASSAASEAAAGAGSATRAAPDEKSEEQGETGGNVDSSDAAKSVYD